MARTTQRTSLRTRPWLARSALRARRVRWRCSRFNQINSCTSRPINSKCCSPSCKCSHRMDLSKWPPSTLIIETQLNLLRARVERRVPRHRTRSKLRLRNYQCSICRAEVVPRRVAGVSPLPQPVSNTRRRPSPSSSSHHIHKGRARAS